MVVTCSFHVQFGYLYVILRSGMFEIDITGNLVTTANIFYSIRT